MENWQNFLESTVKKCHNTEFYERFCKASCSEERTRLVIAENLTDVDWLNRYFEEIRKDGLPENLKKCKEKANQFRLEGNSLFQRSQDKDALQAYNKCVLYAPWPKDGSSCDSLALGLANRSAVLFRIRKYEDCIADIDAALSFHYPKHLKHKVLLRKAKCLLHLGQSEEAGKACQLVLDTLHSRTDTDEKQRRSIEKDVQDVQNKLPSKKSGEGDGTKKHTTVDPVPAISYGPGLVLKNATSAVTLAWAQDKGRYVKAIKQIQPGDTLIRERPFGGVLLPDYYNTHCHNCYGLLTVVFPCDDCARVRFCSIHCQEEALKKYHQTECRFLLLLHCVGVAHLSLRIVLVAGLDYLSDFTNNIFKEKLRESGSKKNGEGLEEGRVYDTSYSAVYDLVTHEEDMEKEDLLQYTLTSVLLLRCLTEAGYFRQNERTLDISHEGELLEKTSKISLSNPDPDGSTQAEVIIGSLILRHICHIICNAHAITELQAAQVDATALVSPQSQVRIATALYPTSSLCNHSCRPSFINSFHKDILVVRAVREITPGEDVYNCYGPQACRMPFAERQQVLKEQYFFTCTCQACEQEERLELRHQALKCPKCEGAVGPASSPEATCIDCGHTVADLTKTKALTEKARDKFIQGVLLLDQGNFPEAVRVLNQCLMAQEKMLYRFNRDLSETHDALARCHASSGNFDKSADHLKISIASTEEIFGLESIELVNELQKYSEVLIQCHRVKPAGETARRAKDIFLMHYGPGHPSVKELSDFIEAIKALR